MIVDFILKIKCSECINLQCKYGLCHEHYSIEKCNNVLDNLYNLTIHDLFLNKNDINVRLKTIKYIYNEFKNKINMRYLNCQYLYKEIIINKFKFLENYYYSYLTSTTYNDIIKEYISYNANDLITLYKDCNNNFKNFKEIKEYFDNLLCNNSSKTEPDIEYLKDLRICNYKLLHLQQIIKKWKDNLIYILYERKLLKCKRYILNEIIKYKHDNNYQKIVSININNLNSYKLFRHILTNDITKYILILTCEYKIKINKRNAYFDLYMMICTINNICLEAVVEIDEKHHMNKSIIDNKRDIIKDLYAFQKGISLLRISTNEVTNDTLIIVINFIIKIINSQKPCYDINLEYINHKQKILKEYIIPFDKKHNISANDFMNKKDIIYNDENSDDNGGVYIDIDEFNAMKKLYDDTESSTTTNIDVYDIQQINNINNNKTTKNIYEINEHDFTINNMKITFGSSSSK